MLIIDQHAAHERILYQEFLKAFQKEKHKQETFILQKPVAISLSMNELAALDEQKKEIETLGFTFKETKNNSIQLATIPQLFKDWDYQKLITEMLEDVLEEKSIADIGIQSNKMLAYLACRSAVKAGDPLTKDQMKKLLEQWDATENNTTCPHGRPVSIAASLQDLHRMFKRV
jgi:DNA mismatch repair protein MutL